MKITAELQITTVYRGEERHVNVEWLGPLNGVIGIWEDVWLHVSDWMNKNPDWGLEVKKKENGVIYCTYVDKIKKPVEKANGPRQPAKVFGESAKPIYVDKEAYTDTGEPSPR